MWDRRAEVLSDQDSLQARQFSADRIGAFMFLLTYEPDSVNENKLLYEMAKFNFTNFLVRNFDMNIENVGGPHQMQIDGFRSYDEAYQYARQLSQNTSITQYLVGTKSTIISKANLELIGTTFSYKDYDDFYAKHFAPLTVSKRPLLSEPAEVATPEERDLEEEITSKAPTQDDIDNDQQYDVPEDNTTISIPEETDINIPEPKVETPKPKVETPKQQIEEPKQQVEEPQPVEEKQEEDVIYFDDFGDAPANQNKNKKKQQTLDFNIDDEYYDLEGF